jgi:hypothetical protein
VLASDRSKCVMQCSEYNIDKFAICCNGYTTLLYMTNDLK